jgi:teichoic acid transport system ATP-binding protein
LGFSIATSTEPEILIIDEALSTGDYHFFQKAADRIQEIISSAKAVVVVTHNMSFVRDVCTRAIVMQEGKMVFNGLPEKAVGFYTH